MASRSGWGRRFGIAAVVVLAGCTMRPRIEPAPRYDEPFFARKVLRSYTIPTPVPWLRPPVVGEPETAVVRDGDTLLDIARLHDLGMDELEAANPGVDRWIPKAGTTVVLPTVRVLPCCTYDGIVVNVPELRLYWYKPGPVPGTTVVETYPVGLGDGDSPSPRGVFRVAGKTVNPTWNVPEDIRQEHIRDRGDARRVIRGGDPDNPLGTHRLELDRSLYRIHGTNNPWGVGRQTTHGCARLFPEDIVHLFPEVPVGTRVEFLYQPVKVGERDGRVWAQVYRDVYRRGGTSSSAIASLLRQRGLDAGHATGLAADGVARPLDAPAERLARTQ